MAEGTAGNCHRKWMAQFLPAPLEKAGLQMGQMTYRWDTGLELHLLTVLTFLAPQSTLQCALLPVQAWERPCAFFIVCILPAFIPVRLSI